MSTMADRNVARMFCVGFSGTSVSAELREALARGVSSVILFTRNHESPAQLADLCWQIKNDPVVDGRPVMISIDQEGGRVQRLREPFTIVPPMRELGRRNDVDHVRRIGRVLAKELRAVNIDMNLAPVLDVDSNPENPVIGERSFGSDPGLVARSGCAMIEGLQQREAARHGGSSTSGVAACGKHFPGHGDTSIDSHLDLPRLSHDLDRLRRIELPPFQAAIDGGVAAIMCAHVIFDSLDPALPATMSVPVIDGLLRRRMGFDRVVCSDDLEMKAITEHFGIEDAVIRGVNAGIDLLFVCKEHDLQHRAIDALIAGVKRGDVSPERVSQANRRLDVLFDDYVRPASRWSDKSIALLGHAHHSPA